MSSPNRLYTCQLHSHATGRRELMGHRLELICGALLAILVSVLWGALVSLVWKPYDTTRRLRRQGLRGPTPTFWSGSMEEIKRLKKDAGGTKMDIRSHDIVPRVLPHYAQWMSQYGETFFYRFGAQTRLCITDVEHVKQVLSNKSGFYAKTASGPYLLALLGRGLVLTDGSEWARHRRVVSPAFTMDNLKPTIKKMADCTVSMLDGWRVGTVQAEGERNAIEVNGQFQELTADIISHSAFGSSYKEGKEVFLAQKELQMLILSIIYNREIPGYKYLPTERNRRRWKLERKIRNTLTNIIRSRLGSKNTGSSNDLLGLMTVSTQMQEGRGLSMDEIVDECKTFFFAGHETTSHLLTWTVFLLGTNRDWQERLREEVMNECGRDIPSADNLSKFKLVSMVLFEALRLYSPIMRVVRKAARDMNLGNLMVPKGTVLSVPLAVIHHSKDLWGDDANEFRPERFGNGVTKAAKHPNALLAFSIGPRACVGQNFAMLEAKMVIALILQRFSFSLSPDYKHEPADMLTLQPQSGLQIVLEPLAK